MSASTRGIVVAADGLDLVVRATAAEVAQFVKCESVDVAQGRTISDAIWRLREDGWRLVPDQEALRFAPWQLNHPTTCAVLLRTRCGCEQVRPLPFPHPPDSVRLALGALPYSRLEEEFTAAQQMRLTVRQFVRTGRVEARGSLRVFEYLEEV